MLKLLNIILRRIIMFNKDSGLVKVWVSLVLAGTYEYSQVPNISNLREVVAQVLAEVGYVVG